MSPQAGFLLQEEIVPRLKASIPRNVNPVGCEDAEELIADATVMAAVLLDRTERQGKTVTAGNIAFYTILHMKSGRRANGASHSDALGTATQLNGRSIIHSLDETVAEDESGSEAFQIHDVLSQDQEDPAVKAARRMDWQKLLTRLPEREKSIVVYMLEGRTVSDVAVAFRVSRSAMQQCKDRLVELIQEFMGADILIEVMRLPGWRNDLDASRERLACRHERRN